MIEYGIFNDEGLIERQFYSITEANKRAADLVAGENEDDSDPHAYVEAICHDHDEQPAASCEECFAERDWEDGEDD